MTDVETRPNPVDDTTFTRPLIKSLQQQIDQLAETVPGSDAYRIAASWVYTTLLVAWAEDHGLIETRLRPDARGRRKKHLDAGGSMLGWLGMSAATLTVQPSTACLLDPRYNPITQAAPSEQAARALVDWWSDEAPDLAYSVDKGPASITGWLPGDMLQMVTSERRLANALCQTPWWVADFLLDRTLVPAAQTFPDELLRVIDPACGTGHLLVWALIGLYQWYRSDRPGHPAQDPHRAIKRALAGLHGVELDPLTAAVARLRLTVTAGALLAGDGALPTPLRLTDIPPELRPRVAVGNSLLAGLDDPNPPGTILDDTADYPGILTRGTYHAVVANPPYITVKDPVVNAAIRAAYPGVCTGKYSLSVPFAVLTFELAIRGGHVQTAPEQLDLFGVPV
ncbi:hypothetical protein [Streptomyces prunicolor]